MDIGALFHNILVSPMMDGLAWLAAGTGSAGLAIIFFTIFVRLLMLPLSIYQSKSQKAMMALQPELKALQKKYGKDRERITQETMRLYREHGVNPASGCLPLLLQMPVFIGLYWALINLGQEGPEGVPAFREPFLWLSSLATPDAYPIAIMEGLALPGILPLFMAGSQYFMSKMMMTPTTDPQMQSMNRMMTIFMPLMLLFFGITFPSGLVLYWAVSNVFSIAQQGFTTGWGQLLPAGAGATAVAADSGNASSERSEDVAEVSPNGTEGSRPRASSRPSARSSSARSSKGSRGKKRGKR